MQIKSIVLIDDDKDDAALFAEALEEVNPSVAVHHFAEGRQGVNALVQGSLQADVLFLDINLPSYSGWQCLSEIKKHHHLKHLPVIMYTTSSVEREKQIAKDLGASGFITKPNDFNVLKSILSAIVNSPAGTIDFTGH